MEKVKTYVENGVEYAEIRNIDWYCKTEYWPFMSHEMFHDMELAETNGVFRGKLIISKVRKADFDDMIRKHDAFVKQKQCKCITNGSVS